MKTFSPRIAILAAIAATSLVACGGSSADATPEESDAALGTETSSPTDAATGTDAAMGTDTSSNGSETASDAEGDAALIDCAGKPNGTSCGGGDICIANACVPSRCGDGYVNTASGEDCEDGNEVSGDGCSACKHDCKADTDCNDGADCTTDSCDKSTAGKQLCKYVPKTDGTACAEGTINGTCKAGSCQKAGCGNGAPDGTEECDDGNSVATDGCKNDCTFTCKVNADCDNGDKCDGTETCDVATHTCKPGTAVTCPMAGSCAAAGTCSPDTGACSYPDADKDGKSCELDCNDTDPAVFPGAPECKDGKDNDCNGAKEDNVDCKCYTDNDGDGFAPVGATEIDAVTCPEKFTRRKPVDQASTDCRDSNDKVHPFNIFENALTWYQTSYCSAASVWGCLVVGAPQSYDYNCNTVADKRYAKLSSANSCVTQLTSANCSAATGWLGGVVPACGGKSSFRQCAWNRTTLKCTGTDVADKPQECH